jgi:hypothetical protein
MIYYICIYIYHKNKLNKKKKKETISINKYGEQPGIFCQKISILFRHTKKQLHYLFFF